MLENDTEIAVPLRPNDGVLVPLEECHLEALCDEHCSGHALLGGEPPAGPDEIYATFNGLITVSRADAGW